MARTARQILTRALKDIEAGQWKKGVLLQDGKGVPEDVLPPKCDVYMGCALGLVSLHGKHGHEIASGDWAGSFYVEYPDERAPAGVQEATRALYAALPKSARFVHEDDLQLYQINESITGYNDRESMGKGKAATWFKKALAQL